MQIESVSPIFPADDLAASIAFYCDRLGFALAWSWGSPPDIASVCRDGVGITLKQRSDATRLGSAQVYVSVSGVDAWHAAFAASGVDAKVPIGNRPYGMRDFRIVDPSGNELSFGQPIAFDF